MTRFTCLTIQASYDPEITGACVLDDFGELVPPPLRDNLQWLQLSGLNDHWIAIVDGRPVQVNHEEHWPAIEAMQAAARWTVRHSHHPALATVEPALDTWPLFLLLGHQVMRPYSYQSEDWALPGVSSGLEVKSETDFVPEYAEGVHGQVSGLLAVGYEPTMDLMLVDQRAAVEVGVEGREPETSALFGKPEAAGADQVVRIEREVSGNDQGNRVTQPVWQKSVWTVQVKSDREWSEHLDELQVR